MKKINLSLIIPLLLLFAVFAISSSGGRDDRRAAAPGDQSGCDGCHSGGTGSVTGTLTGTPTVINPGQTYTLTLNAGDFGSGEAAGFQIAASSGAASPTNVGTFSASSGTRVNPGGRLVHSSPQTYSGGIASWTFDWTAPTENTYSEVTFFYSLNSVDNSGGTTGDVTFNGNSTNIAVPVQWMYANAQERAGSNIVSWGTATEINTDVFEIERSTSGKDFEKIGEVIAATFSEAEIHYEYEDREPRKGVNFYRVKQIDLDGNYTFSEVNRVTNSVEDVLIYPTTVSDVLNIKSKEEKLSVQIFDMSGNRKLSLTNVTEVETSELQSGMYIVQIQDQYGEFIKSDRFLKL